MSLLPLHAHLYAVEFYRAPTEVSNQCDNQCGPPRCKPDSAHIPADCACTLCGGSSRRDLMLQAAADIPAAFEVGAVANTERTLATNWLAVLPAAMSASIVSKTLPASATVQGARCANCAGCPAPANGSSLLIPFDRF